MYWIRLSKISLAYLPCPEDKGWCIGGMVSFVNLCRHWRGKVEALLIMNHKSDFDESLIIKCLGEKSKPEIGKSLVHSAHKISILRSPDTFITPGQRKLHYYQLHSNSSEHMPKKSRFLQISQKWAHLILILWKKIPNS